MRKGILLLGLLVLAFGLMAQPDPGMSTIGISVEPETTDDTAEVFAVVMDSLGNPIADVECEFTTSRGDSDVVIGSPAMTDETGTATVEITTDYAGESFILVSADGVVLGVSEDPIVWVEPYIPVPDPVNSTITVGAFALTVEDSTTITVTVRDEMNEPMADVEVVFESDNPEAVIHTSPATTNVGGIATVQILSDEIGSATVTVTADGVELGTTDNINWEPSTIATFDGTFMTAMTLDVINFEGGSHTYMGTEIREEVSHDAWYSFSWDTEMGFIRNCTPLYIGLGETKHVDVYAVDPATMELGTPELFMAEDEAEGDFDWAWNEGTMTLSFFDNTLETTMDYAFALDTDIAAGGGYVLDNVIYPDMEILPYKVSHGISMIGDAYGIFGDINLEGLGDIDLVFEEITPLQYPVGISRINKGTTPQLFGFNVPVELKNLDGEILPVEHAYPQYTVFEGNYYLTPMLEGDELLPIPFPVNPREGNPVVVDYYGYTNEILHTYDGYKLADFGGEAHIVSPTHDAELRTINFSFESFEPFDWYMFVVLPVTETVNDIAAFIGDETVMLNEYHDFITTEMGEYNIVSIRIEPGWEYIELSYRGFYEMYWNLSVGWNLVSQPTTEPVVVEETFPDSPIGAYGYDRESNSYVRAAELEFGQGYFLYSRVAEDVAIPEDGEAHVELTIYPGWNLIGMPARRMAMFNIYDYPEIVAPIYAFDPETNTYFEPTVMEFGNAFWVLAADTVDVVLP